MRNNCPGPFFTIPTILIKTTYYEILQEKKKKFLKIRVEFTAGMFYSWKYRMLGCVKQLYC